MKNEKLEVNSIKKHVQFTFMCQNLSDETCATNITFVLKYSVVNVNIGIQRSPTLNLVSLKPALNE